MLSTHDEHQLVAVHERTGLAALALRSHVLAAIEPRTVRTAFVYLSDVNRRGPWPRGQAISAPNPAEARWLAAVTETLDRVAAMSPIDRQFASLQGMWIGGKLSGPPADETRIERNGREVGRISYKPEVGDRVETSEGVMHVETIACEVVPQPGVAGRWRAVCRGEE